MQIITVIVTISFCGCAKKEFSNDKWRVKLISAEFLSAEKNYDELMINEVKHSEPLAICMTLDYIGPTRKTRMPEIYIRIGIDTRVKHYGIVGLGGASEEKVDLILLNDDREVDVKQNEKIFGEKGCVLLFDMDKDITYCSLMIDELPPILIKF